MQAIDPKVFSGKMNKDIDPRFLPAGDYIDALNISVSNRTQGREGCASNMVGCEDMQVSSVIQKDVSDECIGIFEDTRTDLIYYFVYSGVDNHRIVSFDPSFDTVDNAGAWNELIEDSALNFSNSNPIKSFDTIEDFIFFTDGYNPPRSLDLNFNYAGVTTLDETYFNIIRVAPYQAPRVEALSDHGYQPNNMLGKFFQFKYRFIFSNKQKSVFSPISDVAYSADDYLSTKALEKLEYKHNAIDVEIFPDGANEMVVSIELAVRSGNLGLFYLVDKIDVNIAAFLAGTETYRFYNSGTYPIIEVNESNQLFDDVPKITGALRFADNRLFMADNLLGYDKPTVDYNLELVYYDLPQSGEVLDDTETFENRDILVDPTGATMTSFFARIGYTIKAGDSFTIKGQADPNNYKEYGSYTFTIESGWAAVDIRNKAMTYKIEFTEGYEDFLAGPTTGGHHDWYNEWFNVSISSPVHQTTFKGGSWYNVGLEYYDRYGRTPGVLLAQGENHKIYVPTVPERDGVQDPLKSDNFYHAGAIGINIVISSEAPSWATHYKVVYARASTYSYSLQAIGVNADWSSGSSSGGKVVLDISSIKEWRDEQGGNILYSWEKGDRIRILSYDQDGTGAGDPSLNQWSERLYEVDILASDVTGYDIEVWDGVSAAPDPEAPDGIQWVKFFDPFATTLGFDPDQLKGARIEIVRAGNSLEEDQALYTESNMFYEIYVYDPGIAHYLHYGDTDQALSPTIIDAVVEISGDAYLNERNDFPTEGANLNIIFETYSISDFRDSVHYNLGRRTAVINKDESEDTATIQYTEVLIPNTDINNTNRVYPDRNFEEYDKNYGKIIYLHNEGDSMVMFQEDKVSKIMVGKNVMYDAQGGANYVGTQNLVISGAIPYLGEYGMHDPASFAFFANRKYWIDIKRGLALRLSQNGIEEISRYGMAGWFNDESTATIRATDQRVFGMYDPLKDEYIASFIDSEEVAVFNEGRNGWVTRLSYVPRFGCYLNNMSFFVANNGSVDRFYRLNFSYWSKWNHIGLTDLDIPKVILHSASEPASLKNFMALDIDGSFPVECIIRTESIGYNGDQQTWVLNSDFIEKEQNYTAQIMRDVNTPDISNPIIEGDTMKGYGVTVEVSLDDGIDSIHDFEFLLRIVKVIFSKG